MAGSFESRTRSMTIVLSVVCQLHNASKASFAMVARGGSIENVIPAFCNIRIEKLSQLPVISTGGVQFVPA